MSDYTGENSTKNFKCVKVNLCLGNGHHKTRVCVCVVVDGRQADQ